MSHSLMGQTEPTEKHNPLATGAAGTDGDGTAAVEGGVR